MTEYEDNEEREGRRDHMKEQLDFVLKMSEGHLKNALALLSTTTPTDSMAMLNLLREMIESGVNTAPKGWVTKDLTSALFHVEQAQSCVQHYLEEVMEKGAESDDDLPG